MKRKSATLLQICSLWCVVWLVPAACYSLWWADWSGFIFAVQLAIALPIICSVGFIIVLCIADKLKKQIDERAQFVLALASYCSLPVVGTLSVEFDWSWVFFIPAISLASVFILMPLLDKREQNKEKQNEEGKLVAGQEHILLSTSTPLQEMAERMSAKLTASGLPVVKRIAAHDGAREHMTATFQSNVPSKPRKDEAGHYNRPLIYRPTGAFHIAGRHSKLSKRIPSLSLLLKRLKHRRV